MDFYTKQHEFVIGEIKVIYTVTLNPAIDYYVNLPKITEGAVNKSEGEKIFFGGKGINVSVILSELGQKSIALGFVAGFTGKAIEDELKKLGIKTDFVKLKEGNSRINVKINGEVQTEINADGPLVSAEETQQLLEKIKKLKKGDTIVLSGSVPSSVNEKIYEEILELTKDKGIRAVVDARGSLLENTLKYKPYLIKPNKNELEELFNVTIESIENIEKYARILKEKGAENVLISMGKDGAALLDQNGKFHFIPAHKGEVKSAVCSGDSMVAGFIAGSYDGNFERALRLANAAGGATAFSEGLAKKDDIFRLFI